MNKHSFFKRVQLFLFFFSIVILGICQNPGESWLQYDLPEEAGWSSAKLDDAYRIYEEIGSSAFMLIYDGKVVTSWGEDTRRFMCHSVRKSLLSALYGVYVDRGDIDIDKTMKKLGIDDIYELTKKEKKASIKDLLKARSGIYHPAAYETEAMKKARPERGSHPHNTFWYYNNWDFNTLCHILMQHTKKDFFEDFKQKIADPLQMEDFRLEDCYYHLEAENSKYPAYPFRLSARDLARIGQLFLQEGRWNESQIISPAWVKESTTTYSENTRTEGRGYAYLWWTGIYGDEFVNYSAQGVGNQAVIVFPSENVVIVNRANTFVGERVGTNDLVKLVKAVLQARTSKAKERPLVRLMDCKNPAVSFIEITEEEAKEYTGNYTLGDSEVTIRKIGNRLQGRLDNSDQYYLIPIQRDVFLLEDAHFTLTFQRDTDGKLIKELTLKRR